jgi:TFIIF-interacting CTD phosphatase-like protein
VVLYYFSMSSSIGVFPRPAIVFGLDETLVSTTQVPVSPSAIPIRIKHRRLFVRPRPGLNAFMKAISEVFDVYFFTCADREYGNLVINAISPETPDENRFFREHCRPCGGYLAKDLRVLKRPLGRILLVDDLPGCARLQPANFVMVSPWDGSKPGDNVLLTQVLPLVLEMSLRADVRRALKGDGERQARSSAGHEEVNATKSADGDLPPSINL